MAEFTRTLTNNSGKAANALELVFAIRRGDLRLESAIPAPGKERTIGNRVLRIAWDQSIAPNDKATVRAVGAGEPLRCVMSKWNPQEAPTPADIREKAAEHIAPIVFETAPSEATPYEQIQCWRAERAKASELLKREKQEFFNFLENETLEEAKDRWTDLGVTEDARLAALKELPTYLLEGFGYRFNHKSSDHYYEKEPEEGPAREDLKGHLETINKIFVKGFEHHFTKVGAFTGASLMDRLDLEVIKDALDLFSTSQLMLLPDAHTDCEGVNPASNPGQVEEFMVPACQPNSGYQVLFAELAHASFAHGVNADLWKALLPSFVRSIVNFFCAYAPPGNKPRLGEFAPKNAPVAAPTLEALRADRRIVEDDARRDFDSIFKQWKDYIACFDENA